VAIIYCDSNHFFNFTNGLLLSCKDSWPSVTIISIALTVAVRGSVEACSSDTPSMFYLLMAS